jgi:hypothetical protein
MNMAHKPLLHADLQRQVNGGRYPNTRKALAIFDQHQPQMDKLLDDAKTDAEVSFWEHLNLMRGDYVRQAFLSDTAAFNRWSAVRCMPVSDVRRRALINKLEADGEYSRQITAELALAAIEHLQQKA